MSVIILGDVHIGRSVSIGRIGLGSALNSRIADQAYLLDWTLEQAIDVGASNIIVTGDIFEEPKPHPALITLFIAWLKKCEINSIHVHIVLGNHDILRTGNYYTSPLDIISYCELDNVSIYRSIDTVIIDCVAFTFLPFRDRKSFFCDTHNAALEVLQQYLVYELSAIPMIYKKVLVGHLAIEGSIPVGDEIDDMSNELLCPVKMFEGYDYVWMGHIHKPQVMSKSPYVAHIGSMDISNFGETDHKKHIIVFDANEKEKFYQIDIPTRPLNKIVISVPKDTKDTTKYVINEITKNNLELNKAIVKLEVHLISPELLPINRTTVEKFLYSMGVHNVCGISESKKLAPIKKTVTNVIDTTMDITSAIKKYA
ncbi:MAG TPA: metallophosphoesterase, partial [Cytophagaceae bacterium]|nr:metallophosphoesterase [Cytophagaceae bacterium]